MIVLNGIKFLRHHLVHRINIPLEKIIVITENEGWWNEIIIFILQFGDKLTTHML